MWVFIGFLQGFTMGLLERVYRVFRIALTTWAQHVRHPKALKQVYDGGTAKSTMHSLKHRYRVQIRKDSQGYNFGNQVEIAVDIYLWALSVRKQRQVDTKQYALIRKRGWDLNKTNPVRVKSLEGQS